MKRIDTLDGAQILLSREYSDLPLHRVCYSLNIKVKMIEE